MEWPVQESIWLRPERRGRGPAPARSRDEIAAAAIRIADADGIDAVSMRRVAAEVGAGTTSLYRYVSRKDELLDLMADAVLGEEDLPTATGDWRADLRVIARRSRAAILRHPWLAALSAQRPSLGPNSLRWMEYGASVLDGVGLELDEMMVASTTLMTFVGGHAMDELAESEAVRRSGLTMAQWMAGQGAYGESIMRGGKYPTVARIMMDAQFPPDPERSFERGLDHILNGIAASLPKTAS